MKIRYFPEHNYRAIFHNGNTLRIAIDPSKPITKLDYPELWDISTGNLCKTGRCNYCYASGNSKGRNYSNIVEKVGRFFGRMYSNQRPFQVAIGGQQEPLEHPDFWRMIDKFTELGIVPNYTTNGVLFDDIAAQKTLEKCGGVAITLHPHLRSEWERAISVCEQNKIKPNIHIIISDEGSLELLKEASSFSNIDNIVLLPYMNIGFAKKNPRTILFSELEKLVDSLVKKTNIAFGAGFFNWLKKIRKWDVSLYEPELLSAYLVLDDPITIHNNSYLA